MPIEKYVAPMTARMAIYQNLININGCVIVDFSTMGHGVFNYGHLSHLTSQKIVATAYTTHINETDVVLGNTKKLYNAIKEISESKQFDFIALMPSAIASVVGIDLKAVARDISNLYGVKIVTFDAGLSAEYGEGNKEACLRLMQEFTSKSKRKKRNTYNILGNFVNEYNYMSDINEMERLLEGALGLKSNFVYSRINSVTTYQNITSAMFNVVTSREALCAAEYLKEKYGMPYVCFRPYGFEGTTEALRAVAEAINCSVNEKFIASEMDKCKSVRSEMCNIFEFTKTKVSVLAKYDISRGICDFLKNEFNVEAEKLCDNIKDNICYMTYDEFIETHEGYDGIIFSNDEILRLLKRNRNMHIDNPSYDYRMLNPYALPFVGYVGACNLCKLMSDEIVGTLAY